MPVVVNVTVFNVLLATVCAIENSAMLTFVPGRQIVAAAVVPPALPNVDSANTAQLTKHK